MSATKRGTVTYAQLRDEGVTEIGRVYSVVYCVTTSRGLRLFHTTGIPHRPFDDYAISLAANMITAGHTAIDVAHSMGVDESHLLRELKRVGFVWPSLQDGKARKGAEMRVRGAR